MFRCKSPFRDIKFIMYELLDYENYYSEFSDYSHDIADIAGLPLRTCAGFFEADVSYKKSLAYLEDSLLAGYLNSENTSDRSADSLIANHDSRRSLLTQKALVEGGRMLLYYTQKQVIISRKGKTQAERMAAADRMALLSPIATTFLDETGRESINLATRCFRDYDFIREWSAEQYVPDYRASAYSKNFATAQLQVLIARKVSDMDCDNFHLFTKEVAQLCNVNKHDPEMAEFIGPLKSAIKQQEDLTVHLAERVKHNLDELGSALIDYLMFSGYVSLAYMWAMTAEVALFKLEDDVGEFDFYHAKLATARFYFKCLLPRTMQHAAGVLAGDGSVMEIECL